MKLFTYLFFDEFKPNIEKLLKCSFSRSNYTKKYFVNVKTDLSDFEKFMYSFIK